MSKIGAFINGVYPRTDTLAQLTRDFDRNRVSAADVKKQQVKDFDSLLSVQKEAGLDYFEDGKLSWQDIFRPIVEASGGIEAGALTRWFDNNTFYRQPVIKGKIKLNTKKLDEYFQGVGKVTLISPFTFAKLTENKLSESFEETFEMIVELYRDLVSYLATRKVVFIQFNEPYIPYYQVKKAEIVLMGAAIEKIVNKLDVKVAVHGYFGDGAELVQALEGNKAIDILGVDFIRTSLLSLPKGLKKDIVAGVVEGRNSLIEEKQSLIAFVKKLSRQFGDNMIYLSNNSDLDLLPESVAREKIKLLGEVRQEFSI
jgi:5-methyltetrahydropteroyltriglutamate--homocysteine methyltransferase